MKRIFNKLRIREYWTKLMNNSTHKKLSEGASQIAKIMPHGHGEEWRGRNNHHKKAK